MSLGHATSDHAHAYTIPGRKTRTDKADGKQFLMWSCECGNSYAADLLTREQIDDVAKAYATSKASSPTEQGVALAKNS